ncbi:10901_t:CDS:2, partial [Cetraspora pellucida]
MSTIQECFFNMNETFNLSIEDFNKQLSKPKELSGRKENLPPEKLRITWKRDAMNCEAKIKITWLAASNMINGTTNHRYLMEESDMCKWSKFIRDMVGNEAIKDYKPLTIANVVRKEVSKLYEDSGVKYLKTKKVTNIKQKLVGLMNSHLIGNANLKSDFLSTTEFLIKNNYQVESFQRQESLECSR